MNSKSNNLKDKVINFITYGNSSQGSTRIRVHKVIKTLQNHGYRAVLNNSFFKSDIIILQKSWPIAPLERKLIFAKLLKKPVYFDIDDYFKDFQNLVKYSNAVITSTQYLKNTLEKINKNIFIVENSLDINDVSIKPKTDFSIKTMALWYGNEINSYILDKYNIKNVVKISQTNADIIWNENTIDEDMKKFNLVIIPQEITPHTLSKTHCRILKALYLGIPVLCSDLPEYRRLLNQIGLDEKYIVYDNNKWNQKIDYALNNICEYKFDVGNVRKNILSNYGTKKITNDWINTLEHLLNTK